MMARNRVHIAAPPNQVFAILADPHRYPEWVVGASGIREHDADFPAVGSRFHHNVGAGPLNVKDHSEVVDTALRVRDAEALARLKRLVEGVPEGDPIRERG